MSEPSAYIKTFHWFWAVNLTLFSRPSVTPRFLLGISCPYSEDPETLNQQVAKRSRRRGKDVKKKTNLGGVTLRPSDTGSLQELPFRRSMGGMALSKRSPELVMKEEISRVRILGPGGMGDFTGCCRTASS